MKKIILTDGKKIFEETTVEDYSDLYTEIPKRNNQIPKTSSVFWAIPEEAHYIKTISKIRSILTPGFDWDLNGSWGTPRIFNDQLVIELDQCVARIRFVNKIPNGYTPDFSSDGPGCFRLNVDHRGNIVANIYGLLYNPESLPDLLTAAIDAGAIKIARDLYKIKIPLKGFKWFSKNLNFKLLKLSTISGKTKLDIIGLRNKIVSEIKIVEASQQ